MKSKSAFIILLLGCFLKISQAQFTDTLKIYYDINVSDLNNNQKVKIDSFINKIKQFKEVKININAFTDYLGSDAYNKTLSIKRANTAKTYLNMKGFSNKILISKGNGKLPPELNNNPIGIKENRKVEIVVYHKAKVNDNKATAINTKIADLNIGDNLILKNVNFYPGQHIPLKEAYQALNELLQALQNNPKLEIEIQGHICCSPPDEDGYDQDLKTQNLSTERAKYVYRYLIEKGIDESRLSYKGFGGKYRLVKEEITELDKMKNRRVEIKVLKK